MKSSIPVWSFYEGKKMKEYAEIIQMTPLEVSIT